MALKIENKATVKLNYEKLIKHLNSVADSIPREHLRGLSKVVLVDYVSEPRLDPKQRAELPGLYHPKVPTSPQPWLEIALTPLSPKGSLWNRFSSRLALKANVTATFLSLVGQHYYLTLSHGVKKSQYEQAVKAYVERQISAHARSRKGIRAWLLRPFLPLLERLGKWLRQQHEKQSRAMSSRSTTKR